jgi:hypothetical protein
VKQPSKRTTKPARTKTSAPSPAYDPAGSDHRDPALRDTAGSGPRAMGGASLVVAVALVAILGFGLWVFSSISTPPPGGTDAVETGSTTQAQPGTSPEQQPPPAQGTTQQ